MLLHVKFRLIDYRKTRCDMNEGLVSTSFLLFAQKKRFMLSCKTLIASFFVDENISKIKTLRKKFFNTTSINYHRLSCRTIRAFYFNARRKNNWDQWFFFRFFFPHRIRWENFTPKSIFQLLRAFMLLTL